MMDLRLRNAALAFSLFTLLVSQASAQEAAQENGDDLWPCIQRKVPELSLPQIWNGPELPEAAADWSTDREVSDLVKEISQRRVPLDEAEQKIRDFAESLAPEGHDDHLFMLARGLFDHMNRERSDVMAGIERYTRKQIAFADSVRKETAAVDALERNPQADPAEVTRRTDALTFNTRVFHERAQSLTYVCEVPTLIEQRLYRLANTILPLLSS